MPDVSANIEQALVSVNVQSADVQTNLAQTSVSANVQAASVSANVQAASVQVNIAGAVGPAGPPGPDGGSAVTWPAGQNMSSGRVVVIDGSEAFYFQPSDPAHEGRAYGITITSATTGSDVDIQINGECADAAFSFAADTPVWVDADGEITNTQPATGVLIQRADVASEAKKMIIGFFCIKKN